MTKGQKQRIAAMRGQGESYSAIASALDISENTVKSYCRRNGLGAGYMDAQATACGSDVCACCGKPLTHTPGAKKKRFCSDECRLSWWRSHPEALKRKAVYRFTCPVCGEAFEAYGNAHRRYCSRACFGLSRRACRD
jgi:endogenous inhibitor of DNA gyrase (YacG/DUF329 family)